MKAKAGKYERCEDCKRDHRIHLWREVKGQSCEAREITVVRGGRKAFLWVEGAPIKPVGMRIVTVSGVKTLRKIAKAILREVGK